MILVCDQEDEKYFYDLIRKEIEYRAHLEIQESKTHVYRYELDLNNALVGGIVKDGLVHTNKQLEYLGIFSKYNKISQLIHTQCIAN